MPNARASPKSASFSSPSRLMSRFWGFKSLPSINSHKRPVSRKDLHSCLTCVASTRDAPMQHAVVVAERDALEQLPQEGLACVRDTRAEGVCQLRRTTRPGAVREQQPHTSAPSLWGGRSRLPSSPGTSSGLGPRTRTPALVASQCAPRHTAWQTQAQRPSRSLGVSKGS